MSTPFAIAIENDIKQIDVKYCGNKRCGTSTGVCGTITHGYGMLDPNGYWEWPCFICARHYEKTAPLGQSNWPFPKPIALPPQERNPDDVRRDQLRDMRENIEETLMNEGDLWIEELHDLVVEEACQSGMFDEVICDLVSWGRIGFVYPGPKVFIATRTRMPNPTRSKA